MWPICTKYGNNPNLLIVKRRGKRERRWRWRYNNCKGNAFCKIQEKMTQKSWISQSKWCQGPPEICFPLELEQIFDLLLILVIRKNGNRTWIIHAILIINKKERREWMSLWHYPGPVWHLMKYFIWCLFLFKYNIK